MRNTVVRNTMHNIGGLLPYEVRCRWSKAVDAPNFEPALLVPATIPAPRVRPRPPQTASTCEYRATESTAEQAKPGPRDFCPSYWSSSWQFFRNGSNASHIVHARTRSVNRSLPLPTTLENEY
jgi:hypothetical protein